MPQNALNKLVRDVGIDSDDDGITDVETSGHGWNRAVIIIGIESDKDGDGIDDVEVSELMELLSDLLEIIKLLYWRRVSKISSPLSGCLGTMTVRIEL